MKHCAFLRGINVSGQKKIKMEDLRNELEKSPHLEEVQSYIQSGNLVVSSEQDQKTVGEIIRNIILKKFGFDVPCIVCSAKEINHILNNNPFIGKNYDPKRLYVTLLSEKPDDTTDLLDQVVEPEELHIDGTTVYLHFPNGYGHTKLTNNLIERKLKVVATSRNWNTMNKILQLAK